MKRAESMTPEQRAEIAKTGRLSTPPTIASLQSQGVA
jgi:hypothetical protein